MRKLRVVMLGIGIVLGACSGSTRITGSWKNPEAKPAAKSYNSVFIAAMIRNPEVRVKLENALAVQADMRDIKPFKSTDYLSPRFVETRMPERQELVEKIQASGAQTIFTVSLLDRRSETRYVPGAITYTPVPAYGWYRGFYAYYAHWYPWVYDPGYYVKERTYFLEANLYDAGNEQLLWSAQSETINPASVDQFVQEYPQKLVAQLFKDGILKKN